MPIRFENDLAALEGACAVEEAEPLLEWARATIRPTVDLSACTHMHAAVLQVLLAARARVAVPPTDAFLARVCAGALPSDARTEEPVS